MAGVENSEENDSSEELVPKKKCTSEIWQYFGFNREDVSQMQVLCKSCRKTVVTSRQNTTNLHSHLEHNHRELFEDFRKCKAISTKTANEKPGNNKGAVQTTIDQSFTNATFYGKTFMDPRFKANYIISDKVSDIRARVMSEIEATVPQEQSLSNQDHQGMGPSDITLKKAKKSLGSFFKTSPAPSSMEPLHIVEVELNNYMMSPTIDSEMYPLTWWQVHQVDFPHLSKLARKYLCIPASSSPSERLFSTSGNVVTCQRTCLKPTKVNMLVFLAKNLE